MICPKCKEKMNIMYEGATYTLYKCLCGFEEIAYRGEEIRNRLTALEEKTIGITNENYLKRGIELSGMRNIVREYFKIFLSRKVPTDFKIKQWLEMLGVLK